MYKYYRYYETINKYMYKCVNESVNKIFHNYLVNHLHDYQNIKNIKRIVKEFEDDDEYIYETVCAYCLDDKNDVYIKLKCTHIMHTVCYEEYVHSQYRMCPLCKEILSQTYEDHETKVTINNHEYDIIEEYR